MMRMKFQTTNELEHFCFAESYIADIQKIGGCLRFTLDNVTILPENSRNRDVRQMRANGLLLHIRDAKVEDLIEEGYKVYDADGNLKEQFPDQPLASAQYNETLNALSDGSCSVYALQKEGDRYRFALDGGNDRTYLLCVSGTGDFEEWDRFLNK